jgi:serine/threonine protein kinase
MLYIACTFSNSTLSLSLSSLSFDTVDERDMEFARKDALALERMTKSPYVANIYGSCGMTQTLEYSDYGNLFDWMKLTRAKERPALSPMERLKFGIQMTTAVADVHSIDEEEHHWVSMTHNDICCHQFIHVDGIFKLGDFHLSTFHKKSRINGMACNTTNLPMNAAMKKVRAPEEMYGRVSASREKVDVYLVGNMMYLILTHKWLFEGMTTKVAMAKLKAGKRPELGFEPTDPADIALVKAINWAWTQDPDKRPKMREVSNFLKGELRKLEGIEKDYVVRVSIPPLPNDYDFSDLQFYQNLGTDLHGHPV